MTRKAWMPWMGTALLLCVGCTPDTKSDTEQDTSQAESCDFGYETMFARTNRHFDIASAADPASISETADRERGIYFDERGLPVPLHTTKFLVGRLSPRLDIVAPGYSDNMPIFERADVWTGRRCFETPRGAEHLDEEQAYDLYVRIAEQTTGERLDQSLGRRNVVGLRGAYPGTFRWHGNAPDLFNDTIVLLWIDEERGKSVREFPAGNDTGVYPHPSASSLNPNRRYRYVNGWHGSTPYNALQMDEWDYAVRDDANLNGHWDSDRNGWLPPFGAKDFDRTGNDHNIHMGSENAPLGAAKVHYWSAGCQVIPGMKNWSQFIGNAWTGLGNPVDYYLVDVRDIPPSVWTPYTPDGGRE